MNNRINVLYNTGETINYKWDKFNAITHNKYIYSKYQSLEARNYTWDQYYDPSASYTYYEYTKTISMPTIADKRHYTGMIRVGATDQEIPMSNHRPYYIYGMKMSGNKVIIPMSEALPDSSATNQLCISADRMTDEYNNVLDQNNRTYYNHKIIGENITSSQTYAEQWEEVKRDWLDLNTVIYNTGASGRYSNYGFNAFTNFNQSTKAIVISTLGFNRDLDCGYESVLIPINGYVSYKVDGNNLVIELYDFNYNAVSNYLSFVGKYNTTTAGNQAFHGALTCTRMYTGAWIHNLEAQETHAYSNNLLLQMPFVEGSTIGLRRNGDDVIVNTDEWEFSDLHGTLNKYVVGSWQDNVGFKFASVQLPVQFFNLREVCDDVIEGQGSTSMFTQKTSLNDPRLGGVQIYYSESGSYGPHKFYAHAEIDNNAIKQYVRRGVSVNEQLIPTGQTTTSTNINAYPNRGLHTDGYYYIRRSGSTHSHYYKGPLIESSIEIADATSFPYPTDGRYEADGLWYVLDNTIFLRYEKGSLITRVSSSNRNQYPDNGVQAGYWYVFDTDSQYYFVFTDSNMSGGVNYEQNINATEDFTIGQASSAEISWLAYLGVSDPTSFIGRKCIYYNKAFDNPYTTYGYFFITEVERDKDKYKFTAYDPMIKLDVVIDSWLDSLNFTINLAAFFASLCTYCGVEYVPFTGTNASFLVKDNFKSNNITGRQILKYIAETAACYAVANATGKIELRSYPDMLGSAVSTTATVVGHQMITAETASVSSHLLDEGSIFGTELSNANYVNYEFDDYTVNPIDKLVVQLTAEDAGVSAGTGSNIYSIVNNPILFTETATEIQTAVNNIYGIISSVSYTSGTMDLLQDYGLNCGDAITVGEKTFFIMRKSMDANGVTFECVGNKVRSQEQQTINSDITSLRGKYHTVKNDVDTLTSIVGTVQGNVSTLSQTVDGISTTVSTKVGNNEIISKINQSAEAITIDADKISLEGLTTINNHFQIAENGDMSCVNATISGTLSGVHGSIGGWSIGDSALTSSNTNTKLAVGPNTENFVLNSTNAPTIQANIRDYILGISIPTYQGVDEYDVNGDGDIDSLDSAYCSSAIAYGNTFTFHNKYSATLQPSVNNRLFVLSKETYINDATTPSGTIETVVGAGEIETKYLFTNSLFAKNEAIIGTNTQNVILQPTQISFINNSITGSTLTKDSLRINNSNGTLGSSLSNSNISYWDSNGKCVLYLSADYPVTWKTASAGGWTNQGSYYTQTIAANNMSANRQPVYLGLDYRYCSSLADKQAYEAAAEGIYKFEAVEGGIVVYSFTQPSRSIYLRFWGTL